MKTSILTLRLDPELGRDLDALATATDQSRSEIVREALRRRLAVLRFEGARRAVLPFAEARAYLTDEDVFRDVT
ncbi:MAG: ribbon-helix-helix domain-containing protein [Trueperaceae bacterium]|nr:ribbon-helix-helix domain-containing protein [Trueperaceae bacterium]